MTENEIAKIIVDSAFKIHTTLGPGLLKSVEAIAPVHKKQVLTYFRLTSLKLGLLINFGDALIKDGIFRVVNGL